MKKKKIMRLLDEMMVELHKAGVNIDRFPSKADKILIKYTLLISKVK